MKNARLLAAFLLFGGPVALTALGDPVSGNAADDPAAIDPDATPRAYAETSGQPTRADLEREKAEQETAAENKDWLLKGYEEQMQARAAASAQSHDNNFYAQISNDKDLARIAGLSAPAPVDPAKVPALHVGTGARPPALSLRADTAKSSPAPLPQQPQDAAFRPFVTPLGSSEIAGLHDFLSNLPALAPAPITTVTVAQDTTDLSPSDSLMIPGMTAAESDPAQKDWTADSLADSGLTDQSHHDLMLELPPPSNVERVQRQAETALTAPGQKPKTLPPVAINAKLLKPVDDTAAMVNDPSPVRGQIRDPYDILR